MCHIQRKIPHTGDKASLDAMPGGWNKAKSAKKKTFFFAAILDHLKTKMFNSEATSFQHFSPRIPNL